MPKKRIGNLTVYSRMTAVELAAWAQRHPDGSAVPMLPSAMRAGASVTLTREDDHDGGDHPAAALDPTMPSRPQ